MGSEMCIRDSVETAQRVVDVVFGALASALPDLIPAASQGTMNNLTFGGSRGQVPGAREEDSSLAPGPWNLAPTFAPAPTPTRDTIPRYKGGEAGGIVHELVKRDPSVALGATGWF